MLPFLVDEAIRLADRIAVKTGGSIQKIATPEERLFHPATEYVSGFTQHDSSAKVITTKSVTVPEPADSFAGRVSHGDLIDEIAAQFATSEKPFEVSQNGEVIDQITRQCVVDILIGRR